jgi:hypothetical protein
MADIGKVVIAQPNRTTITSSNFRPKPNVSFAEINDVSTTGLEDGFTIIYNAANSKFETKSSANLTASITSVFGGLF